METEFKNFWSWIEKDGQNLVFRRAKKEARLMGFEHQISVYGAISDHGRLKAVRFECLARRPFTAHDIENIRAFLRTAPPIGFSLALYERRYQWPRPIVANNEVII